MPPPRKWSKEVTEHSDALDLESGVFALRSPRAIAESLRRSADASRRRKSTAHQSAMSMLNFFINRTGKNLSPSRQRILERAKDELRAIHEREDVRGGAKTGSAHGYPVRPVARQV